MTNLNLSDVRIFVCLTPIRMQFSFDTLMGLAQEIFNQDPLAELSEPCGRIAAATLDGLVVREVLRALEPAALALSLRAIEDVERDRKRLHDQWHQRLERARREVVRAERQYQLTEPENRLVARTLERGGRKP